MYINTSGKIILEEAYLGSCNASSTTWGKLHHSILLLTQVFSSENSYIVTQLLLVLRCEKVC